jgi:hypothetical protein
VHLAVHLDLAVELHAGRRLGEVRLEDVELVCTIPGVGLRTGQVLIAECGIDMSIFPSVGQVR